MVAVPQPTDPKWDSPAFALVPGARSF